MAALAVDAVLRRVARSAAAKGPTRCSPDWTDTPLLSGMLACAAATGEATFRDFVTEWLQRHLARPIAYGRRGDSGFRAAEIPPEAPYFPITDYCGSWGPGYVALQAYRATGEEAFLRAGLEIAAFVLERGPRTVDEGFEHYHGNGRLWVDTLYYCGPLLALAGTISGDASFTDEAVRQCQVHARYLQDDASGCFWHNYDAASGRADTAGFWGRGNGWIAMSLVDTLAELPPEHPQQDALVAILERHFRGLLARQHPTGMWRVVLSHPDAYLETSGTAMIGYGLARAAALRLGGDTDSYRRSALRAWGALSTYVRDADGTGALMGAQSPSRGGDWEWHKLAAVGEQPYATGSFLMLGAVLLESVRGTAVAKWRDPR